MSETALIASDVSVSYGAARVLDHVRLVVPAGAVVCLVGENGAGKSTLLRCVLGLQQPDEGTVRVFGAEPDGSAHHWRQVAATVENPSWYAGLTVREHLDLVRLANGADPTGRSTTSSPSWG